MTDSLVRISLTSQSDFLPLALTPGLPMLDPRKLTYQVLLGWFGNLLAEPELDEDGVLFHVVSDGQRQQIVERTMATERDLDGPLAADFGRLKDSLFGIKPVSPSERLIFNRLQPPIGNHEGYLYRVKLEEGRDRLVWCWGFQRRSPDGDMRLCPHLQCSHLFLQRDHTLEFCPRCHELLVPRVEVRRQSRFPVGAAAAAVLLTSLVGGTYWIAGPSGADDSDIAIEMAELETGPPTTSMTPAPDDSRQTGKDSDMAPSDGIDGGPDFDSQSVPGVVMTDDGDVRDRDGGADLLIEEPTSSVIIESPTGELIVQATPVSPDGGRTAEVPIEPLITVEPVKTGGRPNGAGANLKPAPNGDPDEVPGIARGPVSDEPIDVPLVGQPDDGLFANVPRPRSSTGSDSPLFLPGGTNSVGSPSEDRGPVAILSPEITPESGSSPPAPAESASTGTPGDSGQSPQTPRREPVGAPPSEPGRPQNPDLAARPQTPASDPSAPSVTEPDTTVGLATETPAVRCHEDYLAAYQDAVNRRQQLLVLFRDPAAETHDQAAAVLNDPDLQVIGQTIVMATLPINTAAPLSQPQDGPGFLLDHRSFRHLGLQPGLVVIDLTDPDSATFGRVISAVERPTEGFRASGIQQVIDLPAGTIGQRTLLGELHRGTASGSFLRSQPSNLLNDQAARNVRFMARDNFAQGYEVDTRKAAVQAEFGPDATLHEFYFATDGDTSIQTASRMAVDHWLSQPAWREVLTSDLKACGVDLFQSPTTSRWFATCMLVVGNRTNGQ